MSLTIQVHTQIRSMDGPLNHSVAQHHGILRSAPSMQMQSFITRYLATVMHGHKFKSTRMERSTRMVRYIKKGWFPSLFSYFLGGEEHIWVVRNL